MAKRCTICYSKIYEGEPVTRCEHCETDFHTACWSELGGCATYGCQSAAKASKPPPPVLVGAGWGDEKDCPVCEHPIPSSLLKCHCGAQFPWAEPMSPKRYAQWQQQQQTIANKKWTIIALSVLTLPALGSAIVGPIVGLVTYGARKQLTGESGVYLALGYGATALAVVQTLVFVTALVGA